MNTSTKCPVWFWIVVIAAILWNVVGIGAYLADTMLSDEALAAMPDAERALYTTRPSWVTGAFAVAVFAGFGGSVLLALRHGFAPAVFGVSLIAVTAQMFYVLAVSNTLAVLGPTSAVLPVTITVIAIALLWFSLGARTRGWLPGRSLEPEPK